MNKSLAKKLILEMSQVKEKSKTPLGRIISLFRGALTEQGANPKYLIPDEIEGEKVEFTSFDNLTLKGLIYRNNKSKKWIVGLHGYSSYKESMAHLVWFLYQEGYNLFLFDFRGHGESDDALITYGVNEKKDLISALDFLTKNYKCKTIGLFGASMGAFTLNYFALSEKKLIKKYNIKFGISDSSYYSVYQLMSGLVVNKWPLLSKVSGSVAKTLVDVYQDEHGVDLKEADCTLFFDVCQKSFPILYFHGLNDVVVNSMCSEILYEGREGICKKTDDKKIFVNGPHVRSYLFNQEEYIKKTLEFINQKK